MLFFINWVRRLIVVFQVFLVCFNMFWESSPPCIYGSLAFFSVAAYYSFLRRERSFCGTVTDGNQTGLLLLLITTSTAVKTCGHSSVQSYVKILLG